MAISLVNTSSGGINANSTFTTSLPAGLAQDDVVYCFLSVTSNNATPTLNSTGWTKIAEVATANQNHSVWRKVMGSSPDASFSVTNSGGTKTVLIFGLRGVDTATPEDVTPTTASSSAGTLPDNPSITTITNGAWVLIGAQMNNNDTTITEPSGYSNKITQSRATTTSLTSGAATKVITTAGAEDPATWTGWAALLTWLTSTVAVRPAASANLARNWGQILQ